jgi:hypothetical protein
MENNLINKILEELKVEENRERFNNNPNSNMRVGVSLVPRKIIFYGTGADDNDFDSQSFEHKISILLTAFATLPVFQKRARIIKELEEERMIAESNFKRACKDNNLLEKFYYYGGACGEFEEYQAYTLGQLLSYTLTDNFTNPDWLEILETVYNENV